MTFENALSSGKFWNLGRFDWECMQIRAEIRWNNVTGCHWSLKSGHWGVGGPLQRKGP